MNSNHVWVVLISTQALEPSFENQELGEFAVWLRELKLELCNNLEEWEGMGDGRRGHVYIYGWFMLMYGRSQTVL